jgi:hypothetical protein
MKFLGGSPSWTYIELSALFRQEKFGGRSKCCAKLSLRIRECKQSTHHGRMERLVKFGIFRDGIYVDLFLL